MAREKITEFTESRIEEGESLGRAGRRIASKAIGQPADENSFRIGQVRVTGEGYKGHLQSIKLSIEDLSGRGKLRKVNSKPKSKGSLEYVIDLAEIRAKWLELMAIDETYDAERNSRREIANREAIPTNRYGPLMHSTTKGGFHFYTGFTTEKELAKELIELLGRIPQEFRDDDYYAGLVALLKTAPELGRYLVISV